MKSNILNIIQSKSSVLSFKEILIAFDQKNPSLLKRRLNYYVKRGQLYCIRRGLYVKDKNYDRFELATKIFTPSYVSFETVLVEAGIIFQHYERIFVATYQTREIECDGKLYVFRKIKDVVLTSNLGLENKGNYFIASKERAFLDLLYLNKDYYFDNLSPLDFNKVLSLLPLYSNKRMHKQVQYYIKQRECEGDLK